MAEQKRQTIAKVTSMTEQQTYNRAELDAAVAAARTEAEAMGARNERERVSAILNMDEAQGREASARHLALNTDLSAEVVAGILAGLKTEAPKPAQPQPQDMLRSADARGGLLMFDGPDASALGGLINMAGPEPLSTAEKADAIWEKQIAAVNSQQEMGGA